MREEEGEGGRRREGEVRKEEGRERRQEEVKMEEGGRRGKLRDG